MSCLEKTKKLEEDFGMKNLWIFDVMLIFLVVLILNSWKLNSIERTMLTLCVAVAILIVLVLVKVVYFIASQNYREQQPQILEAFVNKEHALAIFCALFVTTLALVLMFTFAVFYVSEKNKPPNNQTQQHIAQNLQLINQTQQLIRQNQPIINHKKSLAEQDKLLIKQNQLLIEQNNALIGNRRKPTARKEGTADKTKQRADRE